MNKMSADTVTQWIAGLKAADEEAAQRIWERYFGQLIRLVRGRLGAAVRRTADEEDVVLSVFDTLFRRAASGRYPRLQDRDDLWRLLLTVAERKTLDQHRFATRQKRGGGHVIGGARMDCPDSSTQGDLHDAIVSPEPTPEIAAQLAEDVQRLLADLKDDTLRRVALMKMEGFTNEEIASVLGCSTRSVKRKLQVIRTIWS